MTFFLTVFVLNRWLALFGAFPPTVLLSLLLRLISPGWNLSLSSLSRHVGSDNPQPILSVNGQSLRFPNLHVDVGVAISFIWFYFWNKKDPHYISLKSHTVIHKSHCTRLITVLGILPLPAHSLPLPHVHSCWRDIFKNKTCLQCLGSVYVSSFCLLLLSFVHLLSDSLFTGWCHCILWIVYLEGIRFFNTCWLFIKTII